MASGGCPTMWKRRIGSRGSRYGRLVEAKGLKADESGSWAGGSSARFVIFCLLTLNPWGVYGPVMNDTPRDKKPRIRLTSLSHGAG